MKFFKLHFFGGFILLVFCLLAQVSSRTLIAGQLITPLRAWINNDQQYFD